MRGRRGFGRGEQTCIKENGIGRHGGMKQCRGGEGRHRHVAEGGRAAGRQGRRSVMGGAAKDNWENVREWKEGRGNFEQKP